MSVAVFVFRLPSHQKFPLRAAMVPCGQSGLQSALTSAHSPSGSRAPSFVFARSQGARLSSASLFLVFLGYSRPYAMTDSIHILSRSLVTAQLPCADIIQCRCAVQTIMLSLVTLPVSASDEYLDIFSPCCILEHSISVSFPKCRETKCHAHTKQLTK